MIERIARIFGLALAVGCLLFGQQGKLAGPVAGFVFDGSSRALRPIQGIPGASLLGDPVNLGVDLTSAYVSPRQDSAFVVAADNSLHFFRMASTGPAETILGGANLVPLRVVFSPSGTSAALVAGGNVQVFTGLPSAPVLSGTVELSLGRAAVGRISATPVQRRAAAESLTLSDDGTYLLHVAAGSVWLASTHGENRRLLPADVDALVAFAAGAHDAALLDRTGLSLVHDVAGSASQERLAPPDDNFGGSVGLAFSQDGRILYVANATAHGVVAFDLAAASHSSIECDCTPSTLVSMGKLFRLNDVGSAPLWLLDTGNAVPRIVFVPARAE